MKHRIRLSLALALFCAAMSTAMFASDNASLYVVHGIPGRDISETTDPAFPVDILLNDEVCNVHGLTAGTITGPFSFAPGTYDIKISEANTLAPCSNSPLIDTMVSLEGGKDMTAVVALSSTGTPTLLTFTDNFSSVTANTGRVLFAQAADSPAVQVILQNTATQKLYTYAVNPGAMLNANLPAGNYSVEINQGTTTLVPSTVFNLSSQSVEMLYGVGRASNNTVTLVTRAVKGVI